MKFTFLVLSRKARGLLRKLSSPCIRNARSLVGLEPSNGVGSLTLVEVDSDLLVRESITRVFAIASFGVSARRAWVDSEEDVELSLSLPLLPPSLSSSPPPPPLLPLPIDLLDF